MPWGGMDGCHGAEGGPSDKEKIIKVVHVFYNRCVVFYHAILTYRRILLGVFFRDFFQVPYKRMYKSRYLSLNMIPHRQLVLYTGNASREVFIPKEI